MTNDGKTRLRELISCNNAALWRCLMAAMVALVLTMPAGVAAAQEAPADTPAIEAAGEPADAPADSESTEEPATEDLATEAPVDEAPETETSEAEAPSTDSEDAAPADEVAAQSAAPAATAGGGMWVPLAVLAAVVLAVVAGNWIGAQLKMPDHSWKIATILATLVAGGISVGLGEFKLGPDLAGGTTLIYELEDSTILKTDEDDSDEASVADDVKVSPQEMCDAIKKRVDPAGQKEVTIRPYGKAIEVIIPRASGEELEYIKRQITDLGQLEFRILADARWSEDKDLIARALEVPASQKTVTIAGRPVAKWLPYSEEEFAGDSTVVTRKTSGRPEALVKLDLYNVTGEYLNLQQTRKDFDRGRPIVEFSFNTKGAAYFSRLTKENLARPGNESLKRRLGIVLSNELISAPNLISEIKGRGQISGSTMTEAEVDRIVSVLRAGSLPAALNTTPLSEASVSPTLGAATVQMASYAIAVSLVAVLVFMILYYRYAGVVACFALAINLLLVLGLMVMMGAAFTLPGLAGLVLTVGMSVDANVLIYERIREELARGSALRMAIRNGFARATTTIVDANVTTLIAGVVLYVVGTEAIKGFAVTLVLGVLMSMYTAIFCSRVYFEIAERRRWVKDLKFNSLVGATNIDFIGMRHVAIVVSLGVIVIGLLSVGGRQSNLLNIDFTGGTSVTMVLTQDNALPFREVDDALRDTILADKDLLVVQQGDSAVGDAATRYTINSNLAAGVDESQLEGDIVRETEKIIAEAFVGKLLTNSVAVGEPKDFSEGDLSGTEVSLTFNEGAEYGDGDGLSHDALKDRLEQVLAAKELNTEPMVSNPAYTAGSSQRYKEWTARFGGLSAEQVAEVTGDLKSQLESQPIFPLANRIGGKVAGDLQSLAVQAIVFSLVGIVAYVWFRFQNVAYGLAAVVALVHDVLVTLGAIAVSAYIVAGAPPLASALQIEPFQISLTVLAAFLTIIGYSLNDTIVIFDRIREVRGKSPNLTGDMINTSVNQTLSRTLLTSLTTLIVVGILYFFGGPGIHDFAFALVVGVIVGTYSTIFIANPVLLMMVGKSPDQAPATGAEKKPGDATPGAA